MMSRFSTLCTLEATHTYYDGVCPDFTFLVPRDTAALLQRGHLIAKVLDHRLHVLFEAVDDGSPIVTVAGEVVRVGCKLANPYFGNFTAMAFSPKDAVAVYDNASDARQLGAQKVAVTSGPVLVHTLSRAARPATLTAKRARGGFSTSTTVTDDGQPSASFDLTGQVPGVYAISEEYPGGFTAATAYYVDGELVRESLFGVVEIAIAKEFYSAPRAFQIAFQAREETLQYYIVASNYPPADFDQLAVADAGFSLEQRPEVKFTKVPAGAFTPAEIPTSILGNADVKVVLFRSQAPVARRAQGRQRLQLSKNGEPIIGNLCQPGAERSNSDLIVHLAKPKP